MTRHPIADRWLRVRETLAAPPRWAARFVLAEDDWGDLLLPCRGRHDCLAYQWDGPVETWWDRPFNPRRPNHWLYAAASFVTGWIVMVETP